MSTASIFVLAVFVAWVLSAMLVQAAIDRRRHREVETFLARVDAATAILEEEKEEEQSG